MDQCSKCGGTAKYFRRVGGALAFACEIPQHLRAQGGDTNDWRGVASLGGSLLKAARVGATTTPFVSEPERPR